MREDRIEGWHHDLIHWGLSLLAGLAVLVLATAAALAGPRFALVIGNSTYRHAGSLTNPANDAVLIADALGKAGFDVMKFTDLDQRGMKRAVRDFADKVAKGGEGAVALVYYAGHGLQVDGVNYLVPVDANIERESDVAIEAIGLPDVLNAVAFARAAINIVVLDACRDNPLKRSFRSTARGLARVDAPTGSIVAYATAPGQTAADGNGADSPYSLALAQTLAEPGLPIEQVFKQVRVRVVDETGGKQVPWESSSLTDDFFFVPGSGGDAPATPVALAPHAPEPVATPAAPAAPQPSLDQFAETDYLTAVATDTLDAYRGFLTQHPTGPRADQIRRVLAVKVETEAWKRASGAATAGAYRQYLAAFPKGAHAASAETEIAALEAAPAPTVPAPAKPPVGQAACGAPHGTYRVTGIAANDTLSVRAEPNRNGAQVGEIPPGGTGIAVGNCTDVKGYRLPWCEVRFECVQGWVYSRYIVDGNGASGNDNQASSASGRESYRVTAVANWDVLNMRSGPGTNYSIVVPIPPDGSGIYVSSCRSVSGYRTKWCQASWQGYSGWASACCLISERSGRPAD